MNFTGGEVFLIVLFQIVLLLNAGGSNGAPHDAGVRLNNPDCNATVGSKSHVVNKPVQQIRKIVVASGAEDSPKVMADREATFAGISGIPVAGTSRKTQYPRGNATN